MKPRFRVLIAAAVATVFVLVALAAVHAALREGDKAPGFKLPAITGKTLTLDEIRKNPAKKGANRVILLDFWATW